ncbi:MAG: type II toxin-antitoxin system Phd/YefM family antitoxin [Bacteroidales bacterium]|nr:type II toxin-antitoxin system Phd/YefM family antitoxin [Bacteroidales bacterium]
MITATYTELRSNLKNYLDKVVEDSDNVIVNRGKGSAVVIISLEEYESMLETAYVMSQPDLVEAIRQGDEDVKNGNYEIVDIDGL